MSNILEYQGYYGSAEFSLEDNIFHGKLLYIRSLVTYESDNVEGLKQAFHEAVDDYLEMCKAGGLKPENPLKGSFNVRVGRDLHRKLALEAARRGVSLNSLIVHALEREAEHA